jgi:hypothetical protein
VHTPLRKWHYMLQGGHSPVVIDTMGTTENVCRRGVVVSNCQCQLWGCGFQLSVSVVGLWFPTVSVRLG